MDCQTARVVYNASDFLAAIRLQLPGALERLEDMVKQYINGESNPFDSSVKRQVGANTGFSVFHAEDKDPITGRVHDLLGDVLANRWLSQYFSELHNQPLQLGNICCSGCFIAHPDLFDNQELLEKVQLSAVNTAPDGSRIH